MKTNLATENTERTEKGKTISTNLSVNSVFSVASF
jgi:hypothetical protein